MEEAEASKCVRQHLVEHSEALGKGLTVYKGLTVCQGNTTGGFKQGSDAPALLSALRTGHSKGWDGDQCEGRAIVWVERGGCVPADEGSVSLEIYEDLDGGYE